MIIIKKYILLVLIYSLSAIPYSLSPIPYRRGRARARGRPSEGPGGPSAEGPSERAKQIWAKNAAIYNIGHYLIPILYKIQCS